MAVCQSLYLPVLKNLWGGSYHCYTEEEWIIFILWTIQKPTVNWTRMEFEHCCCSCSVAKSYLILCDPRGLQHARLPCPSLSPGVCSNSCPLSQWCHPTTSSSAIPLSSCLSSFPASGPFPVSQFFIPSSQSIVALAPASVLPMNIQGWFLLGLTGLISLLSKGLSRVFSNITVRKHQFFGTWLSLWFNSHIWKYQGK